MGLFPIVFLALLMGYEYGEEDIDCHNYNSECWLF